MVLIDFHKHAERRAKQRQSGAVAKADVTLAISIRKTTLSFALNGQTKVNTTASNRVLAIQS